MLPPVSNSTRVKGHPSFLLLNSSSILLSFKTHFLCRSTASVVRSVRIQGWAFLSQTSDVCLYRGVTLSPAHAKRLYHNRSVSLAHSHARNEGRVLPKVEEFVHIAQSWRIDLKTGAVRPAHVYLLNLPDGQRMISHQTLGSFKVPPPFFFHPTKWIIPIVFHFTDYFFFPCLHAVEDGGARTQAEIRVVVWIRHFIASYI